MMLGLNKKFTALIICTLLIVPFIPVTAHAATITVYNGQSIDIGLSCSDGDIVQVAAGAEVIIYGNQNVQIQCGAGVTLILSGVTIDVSGTSDACALSFTGSGNTLILSGSSSLKSGDNEPGVRVEAGTSLEITDDGTGAEDYLSAVGKNGAGIGGGYGYSAGNITISGGNITASGGTYDAGIGGGCNGAAGNIEITGGTVTASTGTHDYFGGAAIGGGYHGTGGTITISGGTVNAVSKSVGAAIGTGGDNFGDSISSLDSITISGGVVNAKTTLYGSAIGGGIVSRVGTITISGGTINAVCEKQGAGIGSGLAGSVNTINITDGDITATGGKYGAGIGAIYNNQADDFGYDTTINKISISGGTVKATGGQYAAGVGGGYGSFCVINSIEISGGDVTATGGEKGAGIGGGNIQSSLNSINITGGTVTANGGQYSAGIGGGYSANCEIDSINISGGDIIATGGDFAAAIGCGYTQSSISSINITGGNVTATSGNDGAGIGGNDGADMSGNIFIGGGIVFAETGFSYDIGYLDSDSFVILYGDAKVFLLNNIVQHLVTSHYNFDFEDAVSGMVYGETIPASWSGAYSYLPEVNITYKSNGGYGTKTEIIPADYSSTVSDSADFSNEGYIFSSWNTSSGGTGTTYNPGDSLALSSDLTLYAIWSEIESTSLTLSSSTEALSTGETVTLTASILPTDTLSQTVTWQSSDTSVATVDTSGKITAVSAGTATIIATNGTSSNTCAVTVTQPITSVNITENSLSLEDGGSATLTCELLPSNAETETIYWSSSDTSVASVDTSGKVLAAGIGTATITATVGGFSDTCEVTVSKKSVISVTLNYSSNTLFIGEWFTLKTTVSPSYATYPTVTWTSSDTSVATVSAAGVVEAISEGTATITATADGESDTCAVTVSYKSVTSVTLSDTSVSMYLGDTEALTAAVLPTDAANPTVTWTSSDTSVATVVSGVVQAVGEGACTITAEADGVSSICSVYVGRVAVTSVDLSYSTLSMYADDQRILTADVSPSDATNSDVTWESSNESVATVNSNGVVTAIKKGSATITATADGVSDSCSVTVNYDPEVEVSEVDFIVENSSVTVMYVGDTLQLTVAVTPSDATDTSVTWASSDTNILTVSDDGLVTALSVGDATITVTAQGNASATYKITVKTLDGDTEDDDSDGSAAEPTATPEVVIQSEETDIYLTFDLDVSNLGENAKYIQLPNDEVIDIEGKDVVSISILTSDLDNGSLEIVTLDEDMVPLGSVTLSAGVVADSSDEDSGLPWFTVIMLIFGVAVTSIGGTLLFVRVIVSKK